MLSQVHINAIFWKTSKNTRFSFRPISAKHVIHIRFRHPQKNYIIHYMRERTVHGAVRYLDKKKKKKTIIFLSCIDKQNGYLR